MLDLRELGPTYFFAPPRIFESILTQVMIRMEDAGWAKRRLFHFFLDFAKRSRAGDTRPASRAFGPTDALLARRCAGLRAAQEYPGLQPHPRRLHRGRGDRTRPLHLLPLARDQPEAALRHDRELGVSVHPAGWGGKARHRRRADRGRRNPHRRGRRGVVQQPGRLPMLLQEPGGDRRGQAPGRLGAYRRFRVLRRRRAAQDPRPRQGCRAAARAAPCLPRNSSRTSSNSFPASRRRWCSATAGRLSPPLSTSTSKRSATGRSGAISPMPPTRNWPPTAAVYDLVAGLHRAASTATSPPSPPWRLRRSAGS